MTSWRTTALIDLNQSLHGPLENSSSVKGKRNASFPQDIVLIAIVGLGGALRMAARFEAWLMVELIIIQLEKACKHEISISQDQP
jgi:hypothetical protein